MSEDARIKASKFKSHQNIESVKSRERESECVNTYMDISRYFLEQIVGASEVALQGLQTLRHHSGVVFFIFVNVL